MESIVAESELSLGNLLSQGGFTMVPIYVCSIATLAVFLQKWVELRGVARAPDAWMTAWLGKLESGAWDEAERATGESGHPVGAVLAALVSAWRVRPQRAEAEARRVGSLTLQRLERYVSVLSFLAQVAPLLGLLGTVLGMVDLFIGLQSAGQQVVVSELSSGIWKALLTTAAGLTVAVPALAAHSFLASRVDACRLILSDHIQRTLFVLSARSPEASDGV